MPAKRQYTMSREDVERLVKVEGAVKNLTDKFDKFDKKQDTLNTNIEKLNQANAVALDREKNTNRMWSLAAGLLGGLSTKFLGGS